MSTEKTVPSRLVRRRQILDRFPLSSAKFHEMVRDGRLPAPCLRVDGCVFYDEQAVEEALAGLMIQG